MAQTPHTTRQRLANPQPPTLTAAQLAQLPKAARENLTYWRSLIAPLNQTPGPLLDHATELAANAHIPLKTLLRRYYAYRSGGDPALIDRRLCGPAWWRRNTLERTPRVTLCPALIQLWKRLCEESNRSCVTAHRRLLGLWRARDPQIAAIPDYATFPGWPEVPPGWRYRNLMHHAPTRLELTAARQGLHAAKAHMPGVRSSRVGCYPGSHYMFDDSWADLFVNDLSATAITGRPLEVYSIDWFSGMRRHWYSAIRHRGDDGNWKGVARYMTLAVVAATLRASGYSERGTELVMEHGTAGSGGDALGRILAEHTQGLVRIGESGMLGDAAHAGQYPGLKRGNPRHKGALESANNADRNNLDYLPGQTGPTRQRRPDELHGRLAANDALLDLRERLPEALRDQLDLPILEYSQYCRIAEAWYEAVADERKHGLATWAEAGLTTQLVSIGGAPEVPLQALEPSARDALPELLDRGLATARSVRMTRREAWQTGAASLRRLPGYSVIAILSLQPKPFLRRTQVARGAIHIRPSVGAATHIFPSRLLGADGLPIIVREGETVYAWWSPADPHYLAVQDSMGRYLGECTALGLPSRGDTDALHRAMGEVASIQSALLDSQRQRHSLAGYARKAAAATGLRLAKEAREESDTPPDPQSEQTDDHPAATPRRLDGLTPDALWSASGDDTDIPY